MYDCNNKDYIDVKVLLVLQIIFFSLKRILALLSREGHKRKLTNIEELD